MLQSKEYEKVLSTFSLEAELNKIKVPIPLSELARNAEYKKQIVKILDGAATEIRPDTLNIHDEAPIVSFGPFVEEKGDTVAPFYVTLTIHEFLLHNCMLDSGASHNIMPKVIMDKLGLEITKPYGDHQTL